MSNKLTREIDTTTEAINVLVSGIKIGCAPRHYEVLSKLMNTLLCQFECIYEQDNDLAEDIFGKLEKSIGIANNAIDTLKAVFTVDTPPRHYEVLAKLLNTITKMYKFMHNIEEDDWL